VNTPQAPVKGDGSFVDMEAWKTPGPRVTLYKDLGQGQLTFSAKGETKIFELCGHKFSAIVTRQHSYGESDLDSVQVDSGHTVDTGLEVGHKILFLC
jgi:hypothetical protein